MKTTTCQIAATSKSVLSSFVYAAREITRTQDSCSQTSLRKSKLFATAAVATVRPVALAVFQQFSDLIAGMDSVRVTFGLKFSAEAGAIICWRLLSTLR
jgi:hypothetical protein